MSHGKKSGLRTCFHFATKTFTANVNVFDNNVIKYANIVNTFVDILRYGAMRIAYLAAHSFLIRSARNASVSLSSVQVKPTKTKCALRFEKKVRRGFFVIILAWPKARLGLSMVPDSDVPPFAF